MEAVRKMRFGVGQAIRNFDLLLTPCMPVVAMPHGRIFSTTNPTLSAEQFLNGCEALYQYLGVFNVTGQPAVSLPLAQSRNGLPIGLQLVARFGGEATLLRVARDLEIALPWTVVDRPFGLEMREAAHLVHLEQDMTAPNTERDNSRAACTRECAALQGGAWALTRGHRISGSAATCRARFLNYGISVEESHPRADSFCERFANALSANSDNIPGMNFGDWMEPHHIGGCL